jgi:hypothetical protein
MARTRRIDGVEEKAVVEARRLKKLHPVQCA